MEANSKVTMAWQNITSNKTSRNIEAEQSSRRLNPHNLVHLIMTMAMAETCSVIKQGRGIY
jgi:hypothetical protein